MDLVAAGLTNRPEGWCALTSSNCRVMTTRRLAIFRLNAQAKSAPSSATSTVMGIMRSTKDRRARECGLPRTPATRPRGSADAFGDADRRASIGTDQPRDGIGTHHDRGFPHDALKVRPDTGARLAHQHGVGAHDAPHGIDTLSPDTARLHDVPDVTLTIVTRVHGSDHFVLHHATHVEQRAHTNATRRERLVHRCVDGPWCAHRFMRCLGDTVLTAGQIEDPDLQPGRIRGGECDGQDAVHTTDVLSGGQVLADMWMVGHRQKLSARRGVTISER